MERLFFIIIIECDSKAYSTFIKSLDRALLSRYYSSYIEYRVKFSRVRSLLMCVAY